MFEASREYQKQKKMLKKSKNQLTEKRNENLMRSELREKLQKYLLENDAVTLEIDRKYTSMFIALAEELTGDYNYEQLSDTLYRFTAKEVAWD